jgi:uncharacterized protein YneF (UPF0154 family)
MLYIYLFGLAGLVVGAIAILRTYCEGFGCMGLAVLWLIWSAAYIVLFILGFFVLGKAKRLATNPKLPKQSLLAQATLGLLLLGYWAAKNVT